MSLDTEGFGVFSMNKQGDKRKMSKAIGQMGKVDLEAASVRPQPLSDYGLCCGFAAARYRQFKLL